MCSLHGDATPGSAHACWRSGRAATRRDDPIHPPPLGSAPCRCGCSCNVAAPPPAVACLASLRACLAACTRPRVLAVDQHEAGWREGGGRGGAGPHLSPGGGAGGGRGGAGSLSGASPHHAPAATRLATIPRRASSMRSRKSREHLMPPAPAVCARSSGHQRHGVLTRRPPPPRHHHCTLHGLHELAPWLQLPHAHPTTMPSPAPAVEVNALATPNPHSTRPRSAAPLMAVQSTAAASCPKATPHGAAPPAPPAAAAGWAGWAAALREASLTRAQAPWAGMAARSLTQRAWDARPCWVVGAVAAAAWLRAALPHTAEGVVWVFARRASPCCGARAAAAAAAQGTPGRGRWGDGWGGAGIIPPLRRSASFAATRPPPSPVASEPATTPLSRVRAAPRGAPHDPTRHPPPPPYLSLAPAPKRRQQTARSAARGTRPAAARAT
jgi:hypothetical protein